MVVYLLLLSNLLWGPEQFHRVQSSWLCLCLLWTVLPLHCQGTLHQTKASAAFDRMAGSYINCRVVTVSVFWKEFCWSTTGTDTSTRSDSSHGLHEVDLLATDGAVFVKNILSADELSLCHCASWNSCERLERELSYCQCLFSSCCTKYIALLWNHHLLKRSPDSQLSLKVVTPRFLGLGILL